MTIEELLSSAKDGDEYKVTFTNAAPWLLLYDENWYLIDNLNAEVGLFGSLIMHDVSDFMDKVFKEDLKLGYRSIFYKRDEYPYFLVVMDCSRRIDFLYDDIKALFASYVDDMEADVSFADLQDEEVQADFIAYVAGVFEINPNFVTFNTAGSGYYLGIDVIAFPELNPEVAFDTVKNDREYTLSIVDSERGHHIPTFKLDGKYWFVNSTAYLESEITNVRKIENDHEL